MCRIDPPNFFRLLNRVNIRQIDCNRLSVTPDEHTFQRIIRTRIDLLMRHVWRDVDKVTRSSLSHKLESISPPHAGFSFQYVDDALEMAVMMCSGLRVRVDCHCPRPQFLRAHSSEVDCGGSRHPGGLCGIGVEGVARDHADAIMLPRSVAAAFSCGWVRSCVCHGSVRNRLGRTGSQAKCNRKQSHLQSMP